ncbi:MAG: hypothetical protein PHP01_06220 [Phycisphaerae bacterium]|nr:hypothetical protein [Phycisphaerae bacterium]
MFRIKLLILVVVMFAADGIFAQEQNFIKNSGLEQGADGWGKYQNGYEISGENPYKGTRCMILNSTVRTSDWNKGAYGAIHDVLFRTPQRG